MWRSFSWGQENDRGSSCKWLRMALNRAFWHIAGVVAGKNDRAGGMGRLNGQENRPELVRLMGV